MYTWSSEKNRIVLALTSIALLIAILLVIIVNMVMNVSSGIYLIFELYRYPGGANEALELSKASDIYMCLHVEATLPSPPDFLLLGSSCYKGIPVIHIPYDRVKKAIDKWISELSTRGSPNIDDHMFGLLIRAYVLNTTAKEVLYTILDSIPLRVSDLRTPQAVVYVVRNVRGWPQVFPEKLVNVRPPANAITLSNTTSKTNLDQAIQLPSEISEHSPPYGITVLNGFVYVMSMS